MSWTFLVGLVLVLGGALSACLARRSELRRMRGKVVDREQAVRTGAATPQLMHPVIDLSRCLGCGTCVAVCPEEQVLELVHGQAAVVNGARCEGIAACARECPVGAITVALADQDDRRDVPALDDGLEAVGSPGLFLAGEVTAQALIKTAIDHGVAVGSEVAQRSRQVPKLPGVLDLLIVGAGPAGLACALEAKRQGLDFLVIDQEPGVGGTIAHYPRRKLVLTRPVDLPLHGQLGSDQYTKEELMALWEGIVLEQDLPIRSGERMTNLQRSDDGMYLAWTPAGSYSARHVCMAVGRRGTPRRLGIPGEDLPKVTFRLVDARDTTGRDVLVVGGGDSAVEAAIGLSRQAGNRVTLSYRRAEFFRLRGRNQRNLEQALARGELTALMGSTLTAIEPRQVQLEVEEHGPRTLPNDDVFVMIGGEPPFPLLEAAGVSFDPAQRPPARPIEEQGTGLVRALSAGLMLSIGALAWALFNFEYYGLKTVARPAHPLHDSLRPGQGIGLGLGISAAVLIVVNLLYLVRRSPTSKLRFGSLSAWMTVHVATGILAALLALLHGSMAPRDTMGGHAFWALGVLLITGGIGRYLYAWIPRAANGRELELEEVRARLGDLGKGEDHAARSFTERAQEEVAGLVLRRQWRASFIGRLIAMVLGQRDLRRALRRLSEEGRAERVDREQVRAALKLARQAHHAATVASHYEDLRGVLGTWRWLHRWVALLMVVLVVLHVIYAMAYGVSGGAG